MNRSDNCMSNNSRGFETSSLSGSCYISDVSRLKPGLDSRVSNQTLLEEKSGFFQDIGGLFDNVNIFEEILIRAGAVVGTLGVIYGAVEIAKYYHLADYLR